MDLVLRILEDPLLGRDPLVVACLHHYRHGDGSLEDTLLMALRALVERNNKMMELCLELQMRQPMVSRFELPPTS